MRHLAIPLEVILASRLINRELIATEQYCSKMLSLSWLFAYPCAVLTVNSSQLPGLVLAKNKIDRVHRSVSVSVPQTILFISVLVSHVSLISTHGSMAKRQEDSRYSK